MPNQQNHTTIVCLFQTANHARTAMEELTRAGIPQSAISTVGDTDLPGVRNTNAATQAGLAKMNVPEKDMRLLLDGVKNGGTILSVSTDQATAQKVESIFQRNQITRVDETVVSPSAAPAKTAAAATAKGGVIPVVEEQLAVGKLQVERGGVRVYRHVVEKPVEQSIQLNEEHVHVDRHAVNRPATDADFAGGDQVIELRETAEEPLVSKTARVVEEVTVGKETSSRTEVVKDKVRRTEVEVEELASTTPAGTRKK